MWAHDPPIKNPPEGSTSRKGPRWGVLFLNFFTSKNTDYVHAWSGRKTGRRSRKGRSEKDCSRLVVSRCTRLHRWRLQKRHSGRKKRGIGCDTRRNCSTSCLQSGKVPQLVRAAGFGNSWISMFRYGAEVWKKVQHKNVQNYGLCSFGIRRLDNQNRRGTYICYRLTTRRYSPANRGKYSRRRCRAGSTTGKETGLRCKLQMRFSPILNRVGLLF